MKGGEPPWDRMIARMMRHFGQSHDYWETTLTLRLHREHELELSENPPPEAFLAAYFEAQGWWKRPGLDEPLAELPRSDLPEFEE